MDVILPIAAALFAVVMLYKWWESEQRNKRDAPARGAAYLKANPDEAVPPSFRFACSSAGLGASPSASRKPGVLILWAAKIGFDQGGYMAGRFTPDEVIDVVETDVERTGLAGAASRANANSPAATALGGGVTTVPAVVLRTRRGDLTFAFGDGERQKCREAFVAISDLLSRSAGD